MSVYRVSFQNWNMEGLADLRNELTSLSLRLMDGVGDEGPGDPEDPAGAVWEELQAEGMPVVAELSSGISPTRLTMSRETHYLRYGHGKDPKIMYMTRYLYHNLIDTKDEIGIEIVFVENIFLPTTRKFYFTNKDERNQLETFLLSMGGKMRKLCYTNTLVPLYQHREFNSLELGNLDDIMKVQGRAVKLYFSRVGMKGHWGSIPKEDRPRGNEKCSFEKWQYLYQLLMRKEDSRLLKRVFDKYSTYQGDLKDRLMTTDNFADFLRKHQQDKISPGLVSTIMHRHVEVVSKPLFPWMIVSRETNQCPVGPFQTIAGTTRSSQASYLVKIMTWR